MAEHAESPAEVVIGIETPHGLMVRALQAAGYANLRHQPTGGQPLSGSPRRLEEKVRSR
jgi:hypothetical protein